MDISPEQLEQYRSTARARWQAEQQQRTARRAQAWHLAHQAAALLKERFAVRRVVAFGSLTHAGRFSGHSDVDIAAWGLTPANWLRAGAAARALSDEIDVNVVDIATCSPELLAAIERDGVSL